MNINQVAYFAEAVERGSLSAAAKEQFVTVQAVSKAIADLEAELDCELLVRESRGVHPTSFGEAFYQRALKALTSFRELESFVRTYGEPTERKEEFCIGLNTPPFFGNERIRESIAVIIASQMGIKATVPLITGEKGFEELRAHAVDALITIGTFNHPEVTCSVIGTVGSAVMMSSNHPLAVKDTVTLADIMPYSVANATWFSEFNDTIAARYQNRGAQLHYIDVEVENVYDYLDHDGLVLTVDLEVLDKLSSKIAVRPIAAEDAMAVPICFLSMRDHTSPALLTLQKLVSGWMHLLNGNTGA